MKRTELLDYLADQIVSIDCGYPVRVGIDGLSASGKTTLGDALVRAVEVRERPVARASLDNFKRPWSESHLYDRVTGEGYYRNAYDYDLIREALLEPLGPEGSREFIPSSIDPLTQRRYQAGPTTAPDDLVLLADGVFLFRPEINAFWEYRIFLEIPFDLVLKRGADRDQAWEPSRAEAEALYVERYIPSEELYLSEVNPRQHADVVIDTSDFEHPRIFG